MPWVIIVLLAVVQSDVFAVVNSVCVMECKHVGLQAVKHHHPSGNKLTGLPNNDRLQRHYD